MSFSSNARDHRAPPSFEQALNEEEEEDEETHDETQEPAPQNAISSEMERRNYHEKAQLVFDEFKQEFLAFRQRQCVILTGCTHTLDKEQTMRATAAFSRTNKILRALSEKAIALEKRADGTGRFVVTDAVTRQKEVYTGLTRVLANGVYNTYAESRRRGPSVRIVLPDGQEQGGQEQEEQEQDVEMMDTAIGGAPDAPRPFQSQEELYIEQTRHENEMQRQRDGWVNSGGGGGGTDHTHEEQTLSQQDSETETLDAATQIRRRIARTHLCFCKGANGREHGRIVHDEIESAVVCFVNSSNFKEFLNECPTPDFCTIQFFAYLVRHKLVPIGAELPIFDPAIKVATAIDVVCQSAAEGSEGDCYFVEVKTDSQCFWEEDRSMPRMRAPFDGFSDCGLNRAWMQLTATALMFIQAYKLAPHQLCVVHIVSEALRVEPSIPPDWVYDGAKYITIAREQDELSLQEKLYAQLYLTAKKLRIQGAREAREREERERREENRPGP